MITYPLSHVHRSRRLSNDVDEFLERQSRSSLNSESHSPPYADHAEHEAKIEAYIYRKSSHQSHHAQAYFQQVHPMHMDDNNPNGGVAIDNANGNAVPAMQYAQYSQQEIEDMMHNAPNNGGLHSQNGTEPPSASIPGPLPPLPNHGCSQEHAHQRNHNDPQLPPPPTQAMPVLSKHPQIRLDTNNNNHENTGHGALNDGVVHFQYPPDVVHNPAKLSSLPKSNQLLKRLNEACDYNEALLEVMSDGGSAASAFEWDQYSSDSDLADDEKISPDKKTSTRNDAVHMNIQDTMHKGEDDVDRPSKFYLPGDGSHPPQLFHQLPKPKPRNLNLNVNRQHVRTKQAAMRANILDHHAMRAHAAQQQFPQYNPHLREYSRESTLSSSAHSSPSVCTPHRRDADMIHSPPELVIKPSPSDMTVLPSQSGIARSHASATTATTSATGHHYVFPNSNAHISKLNSVISTDVDAGVNINVKVLDDTTTTAVSTETWILIRRSDTANQVIARAIDWYRKAAAHGHPERKAYVLRGDAVNEYQLRYWDDDEDEIDYDLPMIDRSEVVGHKGLESIAMQYFGDPRKPWKPHRPSSRPQTPQSHTIPDVDWEYVEYAVRDEYSAKKNKCILGIGRDRIHIVLTSSKKTSANRAAKTHPKILNGLREKSAEYSYSSESMSNGFRRFSSGASMTGSLLPHFTYIFRMALKCRPPHYKHANLQQHRWIDARVLTRQKNFIIKQHQLEQNDQVLTPQQNAIQIQNRSRSTAVMPVNGHQSYPHNGQVSQSPLLDLEQLRLAPLRSGIVNDDNSQSNLHNNAKHVQASVPANNGQKKRRKSSAWSFNLFGLLNKDKHKDKDNNKAVGSAAHARPPPPLPPITPPLKQSSTRSRSASLRTNISLEADEFTPLSIELCQTISVLKRDNRVFQINFLLDVSSRSSMTSPVLGQDEEEKAPRLTSKMRATSHQSSTRSLSIQSNNNDVKHFQPFIADNMSEWTEPSNSHSPSHSCTNDTGTDFVDAGDYKPSEYWHPAQIVPKLQHIATEKQQNTSLQHNSGQNGSAQNMHGQTRQNENNARALHVFGNDKYLTHTVRYCAKSPEDCCQIVRKIQHLMLLESKAMDEEKK